MADQNREREREIRYSESRQLFSCFPRIKIKLNFIRELEAQLAREKEAARARAEAARAEAAARMEKERTEAAAALERERKGLKDNIDRNLVSIKN